MMSADSIKTMVAKNTPMKEAAVLVSQLDRSDREGMLTPEQKKKWGGIWNRISRMVRKDINFTSSQCATLVKDMELLLIDVNNNPEGDRYGFYERILSANWRRITKEEKAEAIEELTHGVYMGYRIVDYQDGTCLILTNCKSENPKTGIRIQKIIDNSFPEYMERTTVRFRYGDSEHTTLTMAGALQGLVNGWRGLESFTEQVC